MRMDNWLVIAHSLINGDRVAVGHQSPPHAYMRVALDTFCLSK